MFFRKFDAKSRRAWGDRARVPLRPLRQLAVDLLSAAVLRARLGLVQRDVAARRPAVRRLRLHLKWTTKAEVRFPSLARKILCVKRAL